MDDEANDYQNTGDYPPGFDKNPKQEIKTAHHTKETWTIAMDRGNDVN